MFLKLLSHRDLSFLLYEWLNVESLTHIPRYADHSRETFGTAPDMCERIATDLFTSHNKKNDQEESHFDDKKVHIAPEVKAALDAFNKAGLMAAKQDFERSGMQLLTVVKKAGFGPFKTTSVDTSLYPFLTTDNTNLLLAHDAPTQIEAFVQPEMEGRFYNTMCLSEPQAGSSLSDIVTRAEYGGESPLDAQYRLTGNKMWISASEHELSENIVRLVLARIPGPDGKLIPSVKDISLFIVPEFLVNTDDSLGERNDVVFAGLNHKMGYRGTINYLLNSGEGTQFHPKGADGQPRTGAIGYLVGESRKGLACMFHVVNEARIGTDMGVIILGYTDYLYAVDYVRNRPQGRPVGPSDKDAASPQIRIVDHADVRRMLLTQKAYVEDTLGLDLYCAEPVDKERGETDAARRAKLGLLLNILTPTAKSWPSRRYLETDSPAIQVHDGYGYTREYSVERFYRDNRLNPIHGGTYGIQGLDLLDHRVVIRDGAAFAALGERVQAAAGRTLETDDETLVGYGHVLDMATQKLAKVTQTLWAAGDPRVTLANASVYLETFGHVVVARIWLEQALAVTKALPNTQGEDADFYRGKLQAARYFFQWELPKIDPQIALLGSLDMTTLDMQDAWF